MRSTTGLVWAVAMTVLPAAARAQRASSHEIGVDVSLAWIKPSGGDAMLQFLTPVDVRLGFPSSGPLSVEPRFSAFLQADGGTRYDIDPGVNLLYRLSGAAINRNHYATLGADIELRGEGRSGAVFALNGGWGMRRPWGAGAVRSEFFLRYAFEDTQLGVPNTFTLGARVGLSLWH